MMRIAATAAWIGLYVLRRVLAALPTLLVIVTLSFALLRATPGGPFDADKPLLPEIRRSIEARYHLDEPLVKQYFRYLGDLAHGDLGPSFQYRNTSVNELLAQGLPVDALLGGSALLLALLVGGGLGIVAARNQRTWRDYLPMSLAALTLSVPVFVLAPLLVLLFAVTLQWLPAGDWVAGSWRHMMLPILSLAAPYTAHIARLLRASLSDVLASPFIRTAQAKGLRDSTILFRHALPPALLPVISYLGPAFAGVITGSIVVETVFGLPGVGRYFVTGAFNRDYTLVMGITIVYGALIVLFNLLVDVLHACIDPRLRTRPA
jgi:oligopeptide transport system permease protein